MDWFPLYNSLRIALVSSIFVFYGDLCSLLYCKASACSEGNSGCGADSSAGSATYGCRIFSADDPGAA